MQPKSNKKVKQHNFKKTGWRCNLQGLSHLSTRNSRPWSKGTSQPGFSQSLGIICITSTHRRFFSAYNACCPFQAACTCLWRSSRCCRCRCSCFLWTTWSCWLCWCDVKTESRLKSRNLKCLPWLAALTKVLLLQSLQVPCLGIGGTYEMPRPFNQSTRKSNPVPEAK